MPPLDDIARLRDFDPTMSVPGLELAAIDGNARRREEAHLAAEFDEPSTYLAKR
jgi:hypothetical protein